MISFSVAVVADERGRLTRLSSECRDAKTTRSKAKSLYSGFVGNWVGLCISSISCLSSYKKLEGAENEKAEETRRPKERGTGLGEFSLKGTKLARARATSASIFIRLPK